MQQCTADTKIYPNLFLRSAFVSLIVMFLLIPATSLWAQSISLNPPVLMEVTQGGTFTDPGGTLQDASDNPLPWSDVTVTNNINITTPGTYQVLYNYSGAVQKIRYVNVIASATTNTPPVISAQNPLTYTVGTAVTLSNNITCTDSEDGSIHSPGLVINPPTFAATTPVGDYSVTIGCTDSGGKRVSRIITVRFISDDKRGDSCTVGSFSGFCTEPSSCGSDKSSGTSPTCGTGGYVCCYSNPGSTTTPPLPPPGNLALPTPSNTTAPTGFVPCEGTECSFCHFIDMANIIIKWLIGLLFLIFAIMMFAAGFGLVTAGGSPSAKQAATSKFTNAIIGIIIVLVAWLLVDTLIRALVGGSGTINGRLWTTIECYEQTDTLLRVEERLFVAAGGEETGVIPPSSSSTPTTTPSSGGNCPPAADSQVSSVPSSMVAGGTGKVRTDLVSKLVAMKDAAARDGITIKITSAWRSDATQVSLWKKYCSSGTCGATKVAKPCSLGGGGSNHNSGTAVDISVGCGNGSSGCSTATYNWLKAHAGSYGFYNNLPTDPVHWSISGR